LAVIVGTFIVMATSSFGSWNRSRHEAIADLRREVDEEMIAIMTRGEALARATREAAIILHGSVQTQLHACAMNIEQATRNGDLVEVNRALVQARALLEQPALSRGDEGAMSLGAVINVRIAQWRGLLDVSVSIDAGAEALSGAVAGHVADVVEEAIANAHHHGSAREVRVEISREEYVLVVTVRDDGSGPGRGVPGLGSRLFACYGARWSVDSAESGAGLTVRIPLTVAESEAALRM
jgi:signal transduction histidine kinase